MFCTLTGFYLSQQVRNRIRELERFNRLFTVMQTQIEYSQLPTATLLKTLCLCSEFADFPFILSVYTDFSAGSSLPSAWSQALREYQKHSALKTEDITLLEEFCSVFGTTDKFGQSANCAYYTSRLAKLTDELRKSEKTATRLYMSLGVFGGLFLTILLL